MVPAEVSGRTVLLPEPPDTFRAEEVAFTPVPLAALALRSALAAVAAVGRVKDVWRTLAAVAPGPEAVVAGAFEAAVEVVVLAAAEAVGLVKVDSLARTPVGAVPAMLLVTAGLGLVLPAAEVAVAEAEALARSAAVVLGWSVDVREPNRPTIEERMAAVLVVPVPIPGAAVMGLVAVGALAAAGRAALVVVVDALVLVDRVGFVTVALVSAVLGECATSSASLYSSSDTILGLKCR